MLLIQYIYVYLTVCHLISFYDRLLSSAYSTRHLLNYSISCWQAWPLCNGQLRVQYYLGLDGFVNCCAPSYVPAPPQVAPDTLAGQARASLSFQALCTTLCCPALVSAQLQKHVGHPPKDQAASSSSLRENVPWAKKESAAHRSVHLPGLRPPHQVATAQRSDLRAMRTKLRTVATLLMLRLLWLHQV